MLFIAHRGNLNGPSLDENNPDYVANAIANGYHAEIDVWLKNEKIFLGHDRPQYEIKARYLDQFKDKLWCHAKNAEALYMLRTLDNICFWHQEDDMVLTSNGFIWVYPGKPLTTMSIAVMPESVVRWDTSIAFGICTDKVKLYEKELFE